MSKFNIELCKGSNEGKAIYVSDEICGQRLFGEKCRGHMIPIASFKLTKTNVDEAIKYFQSIRDEL